MKQAIIDLLPQSCISCIRKHCNQNTNHSFTYHDDISSQSRHERQKHRRNRGRLKQTSSKKKARKIYFDIALIFASLFNFFSIVAIAIHFITFVTDMSNEKSDPLFNIWFGLCGTLSKIFVIAIFNGRLYFTFRKGPKYKRKKKIFACINFFFALLAVGSLLTVVSGHYIVDNKSVEWCGFNLFNIIYVICLLYLGFQFNSSLFRSQRDLASLKCKRKRKKRKQERKERKKGKGKDKAKAKEKNKENENYDVRTKTKIKIKIKSNTNTNTESQTPSDKKEKRNMNENANGNNNENRHDTHARCNNDVSITITEECNGENGSNIDRHSDHTEQDTKQDHNNNNNHRENDSSQVLAVLENPESNSNTSSTHRSSNSNSNSNSETTNETNSVEQSLDCKTQEQEIGVISNCDSSAECASLLNNNCKDDNVLIHCNSQSSCTIPSSAENSRNSIDSCDRMNININNNSNSNNNNNNNNNHNRKTEFNGACIVKQGDNSPQTVTSNKNHENKRDTEKEKNEEKENDEIKARKEIGYLYESPNTRKTKNKVYKNYKKTYKSERHGRKMGKYNYNPLSLSQTGTELEVCSATQKSATKGVVGTVSGVGSVSKKKKNKKNNNNNNNDNNDKIDFDITKRGFGIVARLEARDVKQFQNLQKYIYVVARSSLLMTFIIILMIILTISWTLHMYLFQTPVSFSIVILIAGTESTINVLCCILLFRRSDCMYNVLCKWQCGNKEKRDQNDQSDQNDKSENNDKSNHQHNQNDKNIESTTQKNIDNSKTTNTMHKRQTRKENNTECKPCQCACGDECACVPCTKSRHASDMKTHCGDEKKNENENDTQHDEKNHNDENGAELECGCNCAWDAHAIHSRPTLHGIGAPAYDNNHTQQQQQHRQRQRQQQGKFKYQASEPSIMSYASSSQIASLTLDDTVTYTNNSTVHTIDITTDIDDNKDNENYRYGRTKRRRRRREGDAYRLSLHHCFQRMCLLCALAHLNKHIDNENDNESNNDKNDKNDDNNDNYSKNGNNNISSNK